MASAHGCAAQPPRSFAAVAAAQFKAISPSIVIHAPALTDGGEPAVFFSKEEIAMSVGAMQHAIIAKTAYGRPAIPEIKSFLKARLALEEDFAIGALDNRHILLRFNNFEDYLKVLLRDTLYVKGKLFRFFKWTMHFDPNEDPVVLPTWVEFPGLPANFYADSYLRSIAGNIGVVLQVAFATQALMFAGGARVCIELDISKPRPNKIWIGTGDGSDFWQSIIYHCIPKFCNSCKKLGHHPDECRKNGMGVDKSGMEGEKDKQTKLKNLVFNQDNLAKAKFVPKVAKNLNLEKNSLATTVAELNNPLVMTNDALTVVDITNVQAGAVNASKDHQISSLLSLEKGECSKGEFNSTMVDLGAEGIRTEEADKGEMNLIESGVNDGTQEDLNTVVIESENVGKELMAQNSDIGTDVCKEIISGDKMKAIMKEVCNKIDAEVRIENETNARLRLLGLSSEVPIQSRSLEDYATIQEDDSEDFEEYYREVALSDDDFIPIRHLKSRKASLNRGPRVTKSGRIIRKPCRY